MRHSADVPCRISSTISKQTRCSGVEQEEQSATPFGVINVYNDSDDDADYCGDQKEIKAEMSALRAASSWMNPRTWDTGQEAFALDHAAQNVDLRSPRDASGRVISWDAVKKALGTETKDDTQESGSKSDARTYCLDDLDPTQRAFADRILQWGTDLCKCYQEVESDGIPRDVPLLRTWLCGSAGSGKSTTLKTIVHHLRKMFEDGEVPAKIELTAYTGVAAFNIGFGARTTCSAFQIFPNAIWNAELKGKKMKDLEAQWGDVELLIIDEISFIGRALFAKFHYRLQQGL